MEKTTHCKGTTALENCCAKLIQVSNGASGVEQLLGRAVMQHNTRKLVMKSITYWPIDTIVENGSIYALYQARSSAVLEEGLAS